MSRCVSRDTCPANCVSRDTCPANCVSRDACQANCVVHGQTTAETDGPRVGSVTCSSARCSSRDLLVLFNLLRLWVLN